MGAGRGVYYEPTRKYEPKEETISLREGLRRAVIDDTIEQFTKYLDKYSWFDHTWADYEYALVVACYNGRLDIVKLLVGKKTNIHAGNESALNWAAEGGHIDIVNYLISCGSNTKWMLPSLRKKINLGKK